jgi:hypothetical protein
MTPQQQFGCPIPASGNIIGHDSHLIFVWFLEESHQSKVTELRITFLVDEDVGGLEIPVDDVGVVQEVEGLADLIDDIPFVFFL